MINHPEYGESIISVKVEMIDIEGKTVTLEHSGQEVSLLWSCVMNGISARLYREITKAERCGAYVRKITIEGLNNDRD